MNCIKGLLYHIILVVIALRLIMNFIARKGVLGRQFPKCSYFPRACYINKSWEISNITNHQGQSELPGTRSKDPLLSRSPTKRSSWDRTLQTAAHPPPLKSRSSNKQLSVSTAPWQNAHQIFNLHIRKNQGQRGRRRRRATAWNGWRRA